VGWRLPGQLRERGQAEAARHSQRAHKILVAIVHMLQRGVIFADLGGDYLDHVNKHSTARRLVRRLDALGYNVVLQPKATS